MNNLIRCCPEQLPSNNREKEVFMMTIEEESEVLSIPDEHYQEIIKTLQPTLTEGLTQYLRPYQSIEFTSAGIQYDGQHCTWYYIEHISAQLSQKFGCHALPRDWKGPSAQCWCGDKLYSPCDDCSKCHSDLRLWITIKNCSIEEIAKSYWPTIFSDEEINMDETESFSDLWEYWENDNTPFVTEESANQYLLDDFDLGQEIDAASAMEEDIPMIEEVPLSSYLETQPWWLPPLETPTPLMYQEHNNFSECYLYSMVWWKVVNPTTYY